MAVIPELQELLALEERIGNVKTGLSEESISKCMKVRKHVYCSCSSACNGCRSITSESGTCIICQVSLLVISFVRLLVYDDVLNNDGTAGGIQGGRRNWFNAVWARLPRSVHQAVAPNKEFVPNLQSECTNS